MSIIRKIINLIINKESDSEIAGIEIPRRELTVESTKLLSNTVDDIFKEILIESCPCHYPRFRFLTTFLHDKFKAGPVFCADTNYFIDCATSKKLDYLTETKRVKSRDGDFDDIYYCCDFCNTTFRKITRQYSINFEFSYLKIENKNYGKDVGEKVEKPIPLLQGLFGFKDSDILKCSKDFTLKDSNDFYNYFTQKAL